ncbi:hypothetical protein [Sorangium sp. So ce861]|uniref:hypothetical protein n=1 Tax=Sorangium sp. So ce861 TaxID=3133323 RepID=UPI003F636EBD
MSGNGTSIHATFGDTTDAQTGDVTLSFSALTSGTAARDHYFFTCLIPQNTRIYSYASSRTTRPTEARSCVWVR